MRRGQLNKEVRVTYPEAPVPKSIATMCVYWESSFKNAI